MIRVMGVLLAAVGVAGVRAQGGEPLLSDDPPYPCPYTDGAFYQPNVFPRYDVSQGALVLVDTTTNATVRVLEPIRENVRIINWSPDCRYLTGAVGEIRLAQADQEWLGGEDFVYWGRDERDIVIWDALQGGRIHEVPNPRRYVLEQAVFWSPDSQRALIMGGWGPRDERYRFDFIWRRDTNTSFRVG